MTRFTMMIQVDKIIGNIDSEPYLTMCNDMLKNGRVEKIEISRLESERLRLRKTSDKGTDIAITMGPGSRIRDGDILLLTEQRMVIVKRTSEDVAMISLKGIKTQDQLFETATKLGHTIGNMHRPIKITNGKIYLPIQSKSEIQVFEKLLFNIRDNLEIHHENMIFDPEPGYDIHGH